MLTAVPEPTELELEALRAALVRAGLRLDAVPEAYASPWRRQAILEAVGPELGPPPYARSPRSTRGAMRA